MFVTALNRRKHHTTPTSPEISTEDLDYWWKFDEGTGGTITDYGPSSLDGDILEASVSGWDAANWVFDSDIGRDVYKNILANNNSVDITGAGLTHPWTFICHVKNTKATGDYLKVLTISGQYDHQTDIIITSGTSVANQIRVLRSSWQAGACEAGVFDIGSWHQIAIIADNSSPIAQLTLYVDGLLEKATAAPMYSYNSTTGRLGSNNSDSDPADGLAFTDTLFYNRNVSVAELADIRTVVLGDN